MRAALRAFLTSASDWAWLRSGSTRARTSPRFTGSPSRCRIEMTLPETFDLTSTLTSGCTLPTSVTLTWMSATSTLPTFAGSFGSFGVLPFAFIATKAMTMMSASPMAERIATFFLRLDAMPAPRSFATYNGAGQAKVSASYTPRFGRRFEELLGLAGHARVEDPIFTGGGADGHDDGAVAVRELVVVGKPLPHFADRPRCSRCMEKLRVCGVDMGGHRAALIAAAPFDGKARRRAKDDDELAAQCLRALASGDGEMVIRLFRGGRDFIGEARPAAGDEVVHELLGAGFGRQLRPLRALRLGHEVALRRLRPRSVLAEVRREEQCDRKNDGFHSFAACRRSNCSCGYEPALTFSCASWIRPFSSMT